MALDSIFLSGWEYNRVLAPTPTTPLVSGLPAPVLWSGGAQFWLFKNVYCTVEAFNGDYAAYQDLGWSTGFIFAELKRLGFVKTVDLQALVDDDAQIRTKLNARHTQLQSEYSEATILRLLETGQDSELERIKLRLLRPVLEHLRCVQNVSPNSIQNWITSHPTNLQTPASNSALALLAGSIADATDQYRAGAKLCRPPGSGLPDHVLLAQRKVEQEVQKPLIPSLLVGRLPQAEYHTALQGTRSVYEAIDKQLLADFRRHIGKLQDLRALAETHIWKDLHGEWLPKLEREPAFLPRFKLLLRDALMQARFDPLLEHLSTIGIALAGLATGSSLGPAIGVAIGGTLHVAHKRRREETKPYTMFFQKVIQAAQ